MEGDGLRETNSFQPLSRGKRVCIGGGAVDEIPISTHFKTISLHSICSSCPSANYSNKLFKAKSRSLMSPNTLNSGNVDELPYCFGIVGPF